MPPIKQIQRFVPVTPRWASCSSTWTFLKVMRIVKFTCVYDVVDSHAGEEVADENFVSRHSVDHILRGWGHSEQNL